MEFAYLGIGLVLGCVIGLLLSSRRRASDPERLAAAEERAAGAARERADAEQKVERSAEERVRLEKRISAAEEQYRQALAQIEEQKRFIDGARADMENAFKAAAADALQGNSRQFMDLAREQLGGAQKVAESTLEARQQAIDALLKPLAQSLEKLDQRTTEIEVARAGAYAKIDEQVKSLAGAAESLKKETITLSTALKSSQVRGRWGEVSLRNVAELCGMLEHCDFQEQEGAGDGRPDMIVRLPGGRRIAVDAKAPLSAYLDACTKTTDEARSECLVRHASALRGHIKSLASREYAQALGAGVDLVVMFLPGEPFLSAAFAHDPDLQTDALRDRVLVSTPTTLVALLRTVAIYHQQEAVGKNAKLIAETARELYERGVKFGDHLSKVGRGLKSAVGAFNDAVGSFDTRFVPMARRLEEFKVTEQTKSLLETPPVVEDVLRVAPNDGDPASESTTASASTRT